MLTEIPRLNEGGVDWQRNLAALWFAEFTAIFGYSFASPFLPLFLRHDLGILGDHDLALWNGVAIGAFGFGAAAAGPVWGVMADRYGRKRMLVRSMFGGGLFIALTAFCQDSVQLVALRLLLGATSGTLAPASTLVAAETPRARVGWSLGIVTSAIAMGAAVGPLLGGLAATVFDLRIVFLAAGGFMFAGSIPVFLVVRESPRSRRRRHEPSALAALRAAEPGTARALGALMAGQTLLQVSNSGAQQLLILRILALVPTGSVGLTGLAFGLAGALNSVAAITYSRLVSRAGYLRIVIVAGMLMGIVLAIASGLETVVPVVIAIALLGLLLGVIAPAISSMIGLEAPSRIQGQVYGVSSSALSIGLGLGPVLGGGIAATAGIPTALLASAAASFAIPAVLSFGGREPRVARAPVPLLSEAK
jgi:MFS family permease